MYTGAAPTTASDTLNVHLFQNFFDSSPGTWDGPYNENFPLFVSSTVGTGSTIAGQVSFGGQSIGIIGPLGPGTYNMSQTTNLAGLDADTLTGDLNLIFDFAAGTLPGASMSSTSSAVPEPAQMIPVGLGLGLSALAVVRRKRYSSLRETA
jgi:hypothetical protein